MNRKPTCWYIKWIMNQGPGKNGKWFFVDYASRADKKVFFVEYESRADLKVFFVDYESRAG